MIEEWFKIPIYCNLTQDFKNLQQEINLCCNSIEFKKHNGWGNYNHSLSSPDFGENIIDTRNLINLKNEINFQVKQYTSQFSDTEFNIHILDSWITNTAPGEHTVVHNHGNSDISGVYYFKAIDHSGNIYFLNPNTSLMTSYFLKPDDYVEYPPTQGLFILFPGWMHHGVRSNDSDENRISVSFNIRLEEIRA